MDNKLIVLIVEDHPATRLALELTIESWANIELLSCDSFNAALRWLAAAPHLDLFISDVRLPPSEMTGVDLADLAVRMFPHLAVLIVSGYPIVEIDGFNDRYKFMSKPFDKEQLIDYIEGSFGGFKKLVRK